MSVSSAVAVSPATVRAPLVIVVIGALLLGAAGGWFAGRRSTRPPDTLRLRAEREARLAGELSHELRTPLTALVTAVDVARRHEDDLPERSRAALAIVGERTASFERLLLELLELARLEDGTEVAESEVVDLEEFLAGVARRVGIVAPVRVGQIAIPAEVAIDKRRLERILVNLAENAERHGGGAVDFTYAVDDTTIELTIDDAGPGIPPEDRPFVFERFWRGPSAAPVGEQRLRSRPGDRRASRRSAGSDDRARAADAAGHAGHRPGAGR